jgi:type I restriction enzyme R subunit
MTRISDAQTRKRFIDQRLKAAGWPLTFATNPQSQDPAGYALLLDGQIVAVIEAKERNLGPQNVHTQAQRDSNGLPQPAPFLYSTNGEAIWHHDICHPLNRSRQIAHFNTPAAPLQIRSERTKESPAKGR